MAKAIPTAEAFRLFLKEHQLTGAQAGELVGLQARQIRRYTGGDVQVPYSVWYTLNMKLTQTEV